MGMQHVAEGTAEMSNLLRLSHRVEEPAQRVAIGDSLHLLNGYIHGPKVVGLHVTARS